MVWYFILLLWVMGMVRVCLPPAVRTTHPSAQAKEGKDGK